MFQMFHSRIKLLILPFLLIVFNAFIPNVKAIVEITDYVNDYANVISSSDEEYIIKKSKELYDADGTQIIVVTVPSLDGLPIEDYALELGRKYGIGSSKTNNGLIMLISLDDRLSRIEVGYDLEGILPDGKTGRIQDDYMIPRFKNGDYSKGIIDGYDVIFGIIVEEHNLDIEHRDVNSIEEIEGIIVLASICGMVLGFTMAKKSKWRFASLLVVPLAVYAIMAFTLSLFCFILGIVAGIIAAKCKFTNITIGPGGGSHWSGGSHGGFSGGGFSGGGGSFGGGGSTRGW